MDLKAYLSQGEVWIAAGRDGDAGPALKIKSMSIEHRRKAARWLVDRAQAMISIIEGEINEGLIAGEGDIRDLLSLIAQHPHYWIRQTALYAALVDGFPTKVVIDA